MPSLGRHAKGEGSVDGDGVDEVMGVAPFAVLRFLSYTSLNFFTFSR